MGCSIKERREADIYEATRLFVGNATSYKIIKPGVVELKVSPKFPQKSQLVSMARKSAKRIDDYAKEEYGDKLGKNWYHIDGRSYSETVVVHIQHPYLLQQALLVKDGVKTIDEVNAEETLPDVGSDFYMGDQALKEQEMPLYEDVIAEFEEVSKTNAASRLTMPTWEHDATKDTDANLTDEQLNTLMNTKRDC